MDLFQEMDATRAEADELFAEIDRRRLREKREEAGPGGVAWGDDGRSSAGAGRAQEWERWQPLGPILSPPASPPAACDIAQLPPPPPPRRDGDVNWDEVIGRALERGDTVRDVCSIRRPSSTRGATHRRNILRTRVRLGRSSHARGAYGHTKLKGWARGRAAGVPHLHGRPASARHGGRRVAELLPRLPRGVHRRVRALQARARAASGGCPRLRRRRSRHPSRRSRAVAVLVSGVPRAVHANRARLGLAECQ